MIIKQFCKSFGCLSLLFLINNSIMAQGIENNINDGIHIYPQISTDFGDGSKFDLVVDYNGKNEIFTDENKRLVLDIDGSILDLKNKNVSSKVKYVIQPSTFSRVPSAVSSKGYFAVEPNELKMIAGAANLTIREVGLLRNYNLQLDENTINEFSNFVVSHEMKQEPTPTPKPDPISKPTFSLDKMGISVSDLPAAGRAIYKVDGGVLVKKVTKSSKAALSGLKAGSVISHINGRKVSSKEFLELYLQGKKGNKVNFTVKTLTGKTKFIFINLN